jgi:hypothetical protein
MTNWYRLAVFGLWLSAMSWLAVEKIVPPFLTGDPPVYEPSTDAKPRPAVGWNIRLNGRRLGWALSAVNQQLIDDTVEIQSLVHFDNLPFDELLPVYLRPLARASIRAAGSAEFEVESDLITSPLNQLVKFSSKMRPKSGQSLVRIEGNVDGDKLKISVRIGDYEKPDIEMPLPDSKIRDSFSPAMELRGLHQGQSWTIVSYSPLALPRHPMDLLKGGPPTEILYAKVEDQTRLAWNGRSEPTWVVVYRSDTREGPGNEKNIRNRLWVLRDGTVVQQEVVLGDYSLLFSRMPEQDAATLRDKHMRF